MLGGGQKKNNPVLYTGYEKLAKHASHNRLASSKSEKHVSHLSTSHVALMNSLWFVFVAAAYK